jgi:hypothetical protein
MCLIRDQFHCCHFLKSLKKIIYNKVISHTTSNNIFTNSQFGFKKKSSTDKAAYKSINDTVEPWIASNLVCECFTRRAKILKEF